jgi:putative ABC transport system substrate-binding protein
MKSTRSLRAVALGIVAAGLFSACSSTSHQSAGSTGRAAGKTLKVVIAEVAVVDVFDQNVAGFKAELTKQGFGRDRIHYEAKNAQGDLNNVLLLAKQIVDEKPDLIYALGTPLIIALAKQTPAIPIVFGLMTDPVSNGVADSATQPGHNLTGTSDYLDPTLFLNTFKAILPAGHTIAIMGNPGEQNTAAYLKDFKTVADSHGVSVREVPVSATGDILTAMRSLAGKADALALPTDNTVYSALPTVLKTALSDKIPVIAATGDAVKSGALVGLGLDWSAGGALAADQAVRVFRGTAIGNIPFAYLAKSSPGLDITTSSDTASKLGLTLPADLTTQVLGS